jgi:hypothetical protein
VEMAYESRSCPETVIWRYMDFTKFVNLLQEKALFFSRAANLGDPFEGAIPDAERMPRDQVMQGFADSIAISNQDNWEWLLVSCWHISRHESMAMWRLYSKSDESIAIQSTLGRLRKRLDEDFTVGEVHYIDYQCDKFRRPDSASISPFFHKRKAFEHEQELRAVVWDRSYPGYKVIVDGKVENPSRPEGGGELVKVDLSLLISSVFVNPLSPPWLYSLVKNVMEKYSLNVPAHHSSLNNSPLF